MNQQPQEQELPIRKWNSPVSKIVCWKCKRGNVTLCAIPEEKGPSIDYVCEDCKIYGKPSVGNQSRVYFKYRPEPQRIIISEEYQEFL